MPIAELLGVQFDMQLLLKLSISAAVVLFATWIYKFYNPGDEKKTPPCAKNDKKPAGASCQNCKTTLCPEKSPHRDTEDQSKGPQPFHTNVSAGDLPPDNVDETSLKTDSRQRNDALTLPSEENVSTDGEMLMYQRQTDVHVSHVFDGSALNIPDTGANGTPRSSGRRSPCFLQKLDGVVGVGRELRQDLEHHGTHSSFLSKAEITVEDANLVLEETGDLIVQGKIYDYYVESSSHTTTDSKAVVGQYERNSEPQPVGSCGSSPTESTSSLSPIIMRDLVLSQSTAKDLSSLGCHEPRHPARPALLRKESYLSAAEQCELPIPFVNSTASAPIIHSLASESNEPLSIQPLITSSTDSKGPDVSQQADLETVAGAPFLHLPIKTVDGTDLEHLRSKLDLGNCLEILHLAKKRGQTTVQQAALQVMSDNYLQVLRDPNIYGQLMAGERQQIQRLRAKGRKFIMVADMDPQDWTRNIGWAAETEQRRTSSAVYYYDDYNDCWQTLCQIPEEVISKACAMCTMDNYLYVAVGCQGADREMTPSKRVFCYNPLTSIWKEISPMNEARPRCKLAAVDGYIYAIGGECLSSVERYDPRLDRWTFVAPLPNDAFAVAHHVTACHGDIFVSGGTLKCKLLRYSPKTNTWRRSLLVGGRDRATDMVAVGPFLYRFDVNPLLGVSVYRYHTVARLWYECSSKRLLHCPVFQCVTMDETIYCVNRHFTMKFDADEISPSFKDEDLSVLSAAKGILFPFVLTLPDKTLRQTSV